MVIQYDKPIEVSRDQYIKCMTELSGICAGQVDNGKYYIKVWIMTCAKQVKQVLQ